MYDFIVIGAGISGVSFAYKTSKYAKTLLVEAQDYDREIPERTNIFAEHNKPFVEDVFWNDDSIFPRPFVQLNYKSEKQDGLLNSKEFGAPLGKISHTEILIKKLIDKFRDQGGTTLFYENIAKIIRHTDYIEVINGRGESFSAKLLVLATGSRGFPLQKSLGFGVPESYMGIYTNIYVDESILNENFNFQYMFHLNPQISQNGPFFFNVGKGRIATGYLGNRESPAELKNKLIRILRNYQKIQPFMKGIKWDESIPFISGGISKHPINSFSKDRVIVLGEAAGLVTAFFYEGILCGLASADIAAKLLEGLLSNNSNFSSAELKKYDDEVARVLFTYFRNGNACEYLFYNEGSSSKTLWNSYSNLLNTNKTVRQYVYEAHINQDLSTHNTDNDRWVGERLFATIPVLSKVTLWPKFLKAMSF
ncbi:MAG: NAD(P)/FAD-dependent oxidoreductase [Candidatus Lokiarchaeota archaeon]|nr:NAD(P)/FAD-dependent oxidoreductase [Candidatus Lokiarchaeota archaeon]